MNSKIKYFSETCEDFPRLNHIFYIKVTRLLIRLCMRYLGFKNTSYILQISVKIFKNFFKNKTIKLKGLNYLLYLLQLNLIYINHLYFYRKNKISEAAYEKIKFVRYKLNNSMHKVSKYSSHIYNDLISKENIYEKFSSSNFYTFEEFEKLSTYRANKKFYLFGPNASSSLNNKYSEYIQVFSKPPSLKLNDAKTKYLFMNSSYYRSKVEGNDQYLKELEQYYEKIIVSCKSSVLPNPLKRAKFITFDGSFSPFMLSIMIYNLIREHGKISCVIEGFDGYTRKTIFNNYYPSLVNSYSEKNIERHFCNSLIEHDAYFNFILLKELVKQIDLIDSYEFKKFISLSTEEYLRKISVVRNFKSIK